MNNTVYCHSCMGEIETQEDLIVTTDFFKTVAYHNSCYANELKKANSAFIGQPINTTVVSYSTFMLFLFAFVIVILGIEDHSEAWIFIVVAIYSAVTRFSSWYKYERHLK